MTPEKIKQIKTEAVKKAIQLAGSQAALAEICGRKQQNVPYWLEHGLPVKHVLNVEKALKGKVQRYELRPDIYPPENIN